MCSLDGCGVEAEQLIVAGVHMGNIQWTEESIGMTATSRCPCGMLPVPLQATRVCTGNFTAGGQWMASNKSACEFDNLSVELCNASVSSIPNPIPASF